MLAPVGKIYKPHGYKGEMNVDILYGPELFVDPHTPFFVKIDNIPVPFFVETIGGGVSGTSFIKLKGVDSDIDALAFAKKELFTLKSVLSENLGISEDEFQLLAEGFKGYRVVDSESGIEIGRVEDIDDGVEYDYLSVKKSEDGEIISIPFIEEFISRIKEADKEVEGTIEVSLPDGFLDI